MLVWADEFFAEGEEKRRFNRMTHGLSTLKLQATEEKSAEYRTLWREWPVVAGLMVMLAASWGMRKFRYML